MMRKRRPVHPPRPIVEALEPRVLYSADLNPFWAQPGAAPVAEVRFVDDDVAPAAQVVAVEREQQTRHEIVFVDASVDNADALIAQIESDDSRSLEVIRLRRDEDGIAQITAALSGRSGIDAVHLVSHGDSGALLLGTSRVDAATLDARASEIASWGGAFTSEGDLLLYGCDVAQGENGARFVDRLAALTGADVAASTDLTGSTGQGGDWDLELAVGQIETAVATSQEAQAAWSHVLAVETPGLWLSAKSGGTTSFATGAVTFNDGQVLRLTDPNLSLGFGTDGGTFSQVFDIDAFAGDGNADVNGLHRVNSTVTVGTINPVTLQAGDVLLTVASNETLGGTPVLTRDVILFRPTVAGDYSAGTFSVLLTNPGNTGANLRDIALVETAMTVGGTALQAGDFLLTMSGGAYDKDVLRFRPTNMAPNPTGGTLSVLIDGDGSAGIGFGAQIYGIDIVQSSTTLGGANLTAGQLLIALNGNDVVGTNNLSVTAFDVFALTVASTGVGTSSGSASLLLRGADVGLSAGGEEFDALAGIYNTAPTLDSSKSPVLGTISEDPGLPVGAVGTLVSALVDSTAVAGGLDNVTDPDTGALLGIAVTAADANGTWYYSTNNGANWSALGAVSDASARLLAADAGTRIYFRPNADWNGSLASAITFRAWDGTTGINGGTANATSNGGSTAFSSGADTASITVTAVNDAPVNTVPGTQGTPVNTPRVFSAGNGNAITIADVDAAGGNVQVTLTASNGTLTLAGTAGLSFGAGDGTADATMTFTGTVASINTALNGLSFNPTANYNGTASLQIVSNDLGSSGVGGALSDTDTVTINVNAAPVLNATKSPTLTTQNEDSGAPVGAVGTLVSALVDSTVVAGGLDNVTDADPGALLGIAVTAANTANGSWWYSTNNGGNWSALGAVSNSNARLLAADASTRIYFQSNANVNGTLANAIAFHAWDRTSGTNGGTSYLAPATVVLDQFTTVSYSNNDGTVSWASSWQEIGEGNSPTSGNVQVGSYTGLLPGSELRIDTSVFGKGISRTVDLSGAVSATLSFDYVRAAGGGSGQIAVEVYNGSSWRTLTTIAVDTTDGAAQSYSTDISGDVHANSTVRFVVSQTGNDRLYVDNVQVAYTTSAGGGGNTSFSSATDTASLTVTAVNDAPVNTVPGAQGTYVNTTLVFSAANGNAISVADVDAGGGNLQVTLTGSNGMLTLAGTSGLSFSTGDGTADATMTFTGTVASINTALNGLSFSPTTSFNGAASLQIVTSDLGNTGSGGTLTDTDTVAITVNTAPVLDASKSPSLDAVERDSPAPVGAVGTRVAELVDFAAPIGQVDNVTDADAGALLGIAVVDANTAHGAWWYSTDDGANWSALGAVSDANVRLLAADAGTRLYFQPNPGYFGALADAITFRAWDRSTGSNGGTVDLGTKTLTVRDTFSVASYGNDDGSTSWSGPWVEFETGGGGGGVATGTFSVVGGRLQVYNAKIGENLYREVDLSRASSATLSLDYQNLLSNQLEVQLQVSADGGATYTTLTSFSLTSRSGSGSYSVDISAYLASNTRIRLYAADNANGYLYIDNMQIAFDGPAYVGGSYAHSEDTDTASVTVFAVGAAPTLDASKSPVLDPIYQNAAAPSGEVGTLVSKLVDFASPSGQLDNVLDGDSGAQLGIAVTAADTANGSWWYSIDGGTTWSALGAVADANARLLAADESTRIYFKPNAGYAGTLTSAITFRAWDQSSGVNGGTANTATPTYRDTFSAVSYSNNDGSVSWAGGWVENDQQGGDAASGDVSITGNRLQFFNSKTADAIYREANLTGATTATLSFAYDNLLSAATGIELQVSANGGSSYTTIATFSNASLTGAGTFSADISAYIAANTRIRLYAPSNANGTLAIDDVQIATAPSFNGGVTAFSTATDTASLSVLVNTAPTLDASKSPALAQSEDWNVAPSGAVGSLVSTLVDFASPAGQVDNVTDPDINPKTGIAVTAANTTNGSWWYTTNGGASWSTLGAVSTSSARLLAADANTRIYFQANPGYTGTVANALTFHAWDRSTGTNGTTTDTRNLSWRDNFSANAFTNSDGTAAWAGAWVETDGGGTGATVGDISVSGGQLVMNGPKSGDNLYRQADLSTLTAATVSFSYNNLISGNLPVNFQISANGGSTWTTLISFEATVNPGAGTFSADISAYLASNTRIRFVAGGNLNGSITIDNVAIVAPDRSGGTTSLSSATDTVSLTVYHVAHTPSVTGATTNEDVQTTSGLVITRNAADGAEVIYFKITDIANGTLYLNDGVTQVTEGSFITFAQGNAGLKFTPTADFNGSTSFKVQASTSNTDAGLGGSKVTATITVNAVNDAPLLAAVEGTALAYTEGDAAVAVTATITAGDVDNTDLTGATIQITGNYASGQDVLSFIDTGTITGSWNAISGTLTLSGTDTLTNYQAALRSVTYHNSSESPSGLARTVSFKVSDGALASNTVTRSIAVTPVNDPPVIISNGGGASALVTLDENVAAVTTVTSSDVDGGPAVYSIAGGADAARFTINASSGALSFLSAPNFEAPGDAGGDNVYDVIVQVSDGAGGTDTQAIAVTIVDVDEFDVGPITDTDGTLEAVDENAANGTAVGITATASDADASNNTITYTLDDSAGGRFAIDSSTGVVTVAGAIDREAAASHTISVRATSADGSFSTRNFTIAVNDLDEFDVGAVSDADAAPDAVPETALVGTAVGLTAYATDGDAADGITYSLDDSAGGLFAIDAATGVVTVNGVLDYETATSHAIVVRATSDDGSFATQGFTINVIDVSEAAVGPIGDTDAGANAVAENAANGTAVGLTAWADDPDLGDTVSYSLDDNAGGRFAIDAVTGVVTVADGSLLDREAAASHAITVRATSTDTTFSTRVFSIALNDVDEFDVGAVSDIDAVANVVTENAAFGTTVGVRAAASDADATTNAITYSLSNDDGGRFAINAGTGVVTVADAIDREADGATRSITVRATSADGSFTDQAFSIAVNDVDEFNVTAPVDTDAAANAVDENAANGTVVGITAFASDADATNNTVTYSLSDSAGGRFAIDANTGVVTVADGSLLDREAAASHAITVRATSADGSIADANFTIALNDVDEFDVTAPVDNDANANAVDENAANGTVVGIIAFATDADATTNTVTYSLADSAGGRFVIDASSGVVTVADGSLLDREAAASYGITVRATSIDGSTADTVFTINVNDVDEFDVTDPVDTDGTTNAVDENAANGTTVGITAFASDADATNNTVTYSLSDSAGGRFAIDANTGVVTVAGTIDREAAASHDITVRATSADGSTADSVFTVNVNDVDEFDVGAVSDIDAAANVVNENAGIGTTVGVRATASDADATTNAITYSLSDSAGGRFAIDANTGVVTVADGSLLDREAAASHDITVRATSADGSFADQTFSIAVNPVNDNAPVITSGGGGASAAISVAENTTAVTTVTATDADLPAQTLTYSIAGGADAAKFAIDSATGVLGFLAAPNYDSPTDVGSDNVYDVTVQVSDGNGGTDTQAIAVTVTNINEAPAGTDETVTVLEDGIYTFTTADFGFSDASDSPANNLLAVKIATLPAAGSLTLNGVAVTAGQFVSAANITSGLLKFAPVADANGAAYASFTFQVQDDGGIANGGVDLDQSANTITLDVTAVNDAPTVANPIADQSTAEDAAYSYQFASNVFADVDVGDSLTYTASGLPTWLSFDAATRTFSGTPANADVGSATITVRATDGSGAWVEDQFDLVVANTNDAPTVANPIADQSATEDAPFNFTFAANTFADVDVGDSLTYTASGVPAWLSFDAATRTFSGTPANADVGTFTLTVRATDGSGAFVEDQFDIVVANTNDAPTVANAIPDQAATEDSAFSFQFAANTFADVDVGDTLSYTASGVPAWLSFDAATRTFSGTPANADVGSATITVRATDGSGAWVEDQFDLVVANTNDAPTLANPIADQAATEDAPFSFQFAANTFADVDTGDSLSYTASGVPAWLSFDAATRTFSGTPTNSDVGTVTLTVRATDGSGAFVEDQFDIVVANTNDAPVVANPIADQAATEDAPFSFTFAANTFDDVDVGDTLTYTASGVPSWLSFDAATRTFSGTPANADVGTVTLTVRATDGSGAWVEDQFDIVVANTNDAPTVANPIADQSATEDSAFSFTFVANTFDDVDVGDTLTYTASGVPAWLTFDAATRTFSGTPANADVGTVTLTVRATDGSGAFVEDQFDIVVANTNDAPTVANPIADQAATEDAPFSFTFAANTFSDVDVGDTLAYTASGVPSWLTFDAGTRTFSGTPANADVGTVTLTVRATDGSGAWVEDQFDIVVANTNDAPTVANPIADQAATEDAPFSFTFAANTFDDVDVGDTLSYTASGVPAWLTFDAATRTFSGTPANADVGSATITVRATDGSGAWVEDQFDIVVANTNDAPTVANPIADQSATEDSAFSFTFVANTFDDVDVGDTLTYTASGVPAWLTFDAATRTFSGTPTNSDVGTVAITVRATDGSGAWVEDTFDIVVANANDAPTVANPIADQAATEDSAFSFQFAANTFADVDVGDSLSYTASGLPGWLSFDAATRTFSGTPANADVGAVTVTVRATDGSGAFVEDQFGITVTNTNDAPTLANPIADQAATEDSAFSFQFAANTFADVDVGDTLSYTASGLPGWLSFDAATRTFSGTPANADVGSATITVRATDTSGAWVEDTFDIVVANTNDAPTLANPIADQAATEDSAFSFTFAANTFTDVDVGDTLTYTASSVPAWLTFDAATRTFSGTPTNSDVGTVAITVRATDTSGVWVEDTFDIVVANTNDAPTGAVLAAGTPTENQTLSADSATVADDDGLGTFSYQWLRDGAPVAGATGSSYRLGDADVGARISVRVSYTDARGTDESLVSAQVGPVANVNDAPTGAAEIAGTPTEDQTLSAETATIADADALGTFSYQWLRDGAPVAGATGPTYALGDADVGASVSVRVTYTDGWGTTETLMSAPSAPIANLNDAPVGLPVLLGTTAVGYTVVADTAAIVDADGLGTFSYQWLRDGTPIAGATSPSYLLSAEDAGRELSLRLTYTDANGTSESLVSVFSGVATEADDPAPAVPVIEPPVVPVAPPPTVVESEPGERDSSASREARGLPSLPTETSRGAEVTPASVEAPEFDVQSPRDVLVAVRHDLSRDAEPVADGPVEPGQELVVLTAWDDAGMRLPGGWNLANALRRGLSIEAGEDEALAGGDRDSRGQADADFGLGNVSTLQAVGATFTAGFIWWLTRSGGMLTMMLMGIPAWRHVDLLPVLAREHDDDEEDDEEVALPAAPLHTSYDQLGSHESRLADLFGADTTAEANPRNTR